MRPVFVSSHCYPSVVDLLKNLNCSPILVPELPNVDRRTSYHTDLSLCVLGNTVICAPSLYGCLSDVEGYKLIKGYSEPCDPYPYDIPYNVLVVGNYIFCRKDKTDKVLLSAVEDLGYEIINVNQGYSRCSSLPVGDSALITSDPSIFKAAQIVGIDVLGVSDDGICLEGFPNGFIGGTGGTVEGNTVFFGDISKHCDYNRIKEFCNKHGFSIYFTAEPLRDFGSLLC